MLRLVGDMTHADETPVIRSYGQSGPTKYQLVRDIRRAYPGANLRISMYDTVVASSESGVRARVVLETCRVREAATVTRITHRGTRTINLIQVGELEWQIVSEKTIWYKLDQPETIQELGLGGRSIQDWLAHVEWQRQAHRPGMGGRLGERDSWTRVNVPAPGSKRATPGGVWTGE